MTIIEREKVRAAAERALALDPNGDPWDAFLAASQSLGVPPETVEEVYINEGPEA